MDEVDYDSDYRDALLRGGKKLDYHTTEKQKKADQEKEKAKRAKRKAKKAKRKQATKNPNRRLRGGSETARKAEEERKANAELTDTSDEEIVLPTNHFLLLYK